MIKTENKAIGSRGYVYTVTQFGAREGGRMLVRLAKLLGKPIGEAMAGGIDFKTAGNVVAQLAETLTEDEFDHLCTSFAGRSSVSGGSVEDQRFNYGAKQVPLRDSAIFDLHFAGDYVELFQWLAFALEVNYGGFLPVIQQARSLAQDLRGSATEEKESLSTSQNISDQSGLSGG